MVHEPPTPWPLLEIAIEPTSRADGARFGAALARLATEDPSLVVSIDAESGQTILGGASELHLDSTVGALRRGCGFDIAIGAPQVAYRETIARSAEVDQTHKRLTAGAGQFARVILRVAPRAFGGGFVFGSKIVVGAMPEDFVEGVEAGVRSAMEAGIVAGFPVIDVEVSLLDGAFHDVDSSALAFETASRAAVREALRKGGASLLEPIMTVEVATPEDYVGAVVGDLVSRRGEIGRQETSGDAIVVTAMVPLANTFGYANALRSSTRGAGRFSMRYAHYARVPTPGDFDPPPAAAAALRP